MEATREKLLAAQNEINVEYSGGNEDQLVQIPLENLYISYVDNILSGEEEVTYLAYVIKTPEEDASYALHFPVDFKNLVHSITDTHLLANPDSSFTMLKPEFTNIRDEDKRIEHFDTTQNSIRNFNSLTELEDGVPKGITIDLLSGKAHTNDYRFSLPKYSVDYLLGKKS